LCTKREKGKNVANSNGKLTPDERDPCDLDHPLLDFYIRWALDDVQQYLFIPLTSGRLEELDWFPRIIAAEAMQGVGLM